MALLFVEDPADGPGDATGRLFGLGAAGPGSVSLHCCQSHARPSRIGLLAGAGGGGGGGGGVVVLLVFGVTTTWLSIAYDVIVSSSIQNCIQIKVVSTSGEYKFKELKVIICVILSIVHKMNKGKSKMNEKCFTLLTLMVLRK